MSSKRLLLIEDDFDVAEMLLMYFQSHDYDVLHADTVLPKKPWAVPFGFAMAITVLMMCKLRFRMAFI